MQTLKIVWQRLVSDGATCPRCGSTQENLKAAVTKLEAVLRPLDIAVELEDQVIDEAAFRVDPNQSNRIWIGGKPMEDWLGASAGSSPCCAVCGDSECRTMEVDGKTYEAIPEGLIIKATLSAASSLTTPESTSQGGCGGSSPCGCR